MRLIHIMTYILSGYCPPWDIEASRVGKTQGPFALFNGLVLGHTKYKGVQRVYCNPFPSKMFYGSHRMDPSWFGRLASIMELSLYHQTQSGMLVYCSCSLLLLWPTLDPSPSIVPSFQPWKHMLILKMVIICIIHIISIISIICIYLHYDNYAFYINYCWLISFVGWLESVGSRVVYELDYKKPILYVVPIQNIRANFPLCL